MEESSIYEAIIGLNNRLKRLELISSDLEDQLDELGDLTTTKYQFQNDFAAFNDYRDDIKIIENFKSDLEIEAYIKELQDTIELVRK